MKKQGNHGLWWSFLVIFIVLVLDQILKIWVKTNMSLGQEIPVIGRWFKLLFIENNGMAFGWLGSGGALKLALSLFRIVAIIALFIILIRLSKKNAKFGVLFGLSLITAVASIIRIMPTTTMISISVKPARPFMPYSAARSDRAVTSSSHRCS